MLTHLRSEYGTLTPEELEKNCAALSDPWNLDEPLEDLWAKIANIQRLATFGNVPILDITIITLRPVSLPPQPKSFAYNPLTNGLFPYSSRNFTWATRNASADSQLMTPDSTVHIPSLARHSPSLPSPLLSSLLSIPRPRLLPAMSPLKVARCIAAGLMGSVRSALTHLKRACTKPTDTATTYLPSECVAATTPFPPGAPVNFYRQTTDVKGSLQSQL
jgi:hypothetical protein